MAANFLYKKTSKILLQVSEIAGYLWERGWAERNGGNLSVNVTHEVGKLSKTFLKSCSHFQDKRMPKKLAGYSFFITGTGSRLRDLRTPAGIEHNACILTIDPQAKGYFIIWGGKNKNFRPTSELSAHLETYLDLIIHKDPRKALLHTHPTDLLALSHSPKHGRTSKQLSETLWSMMPETRVFVPRGIEFIPYTLPGSMQLAKLNAKALRKKDLVIWEKHGAVAAGENLIAAFDFIDVANKSAIIFLKCLSAGFKPNGLSKKEIQALEKAYLK